MRGRPARATSQDPTQVRLSEHFLLSDFMGNNSVYTKGYKNVFVDPDGSKLAEAKYLCENLLEPILLEYGPLSISYGYISPELSKAIITYQDPDMPSYHRWDKGAAADICVHAWVEGDPPIKLAHDIDERFGYSRMITYAESPFICVATQINEGDAHRKAFYENRYTGKKGAKPLYIKKSATAAGRKAQGNAIPSTLDWEGAGYPTYHGGGIRQLHHNHISRFAVVSDFLYSTHGVCTGVANAPSLGRHRESFRKAGEFYDSLLEILDTPRISIVRAFESFRFNDYPAFSWNDHFAIDCIAPAYITPSQLADAAIATGMVVSVGGSFGKGVIRCIGRDNNA